MAEYNAELTRQLAYGQRKHRRSEPLNRLGRQVVFPIAGLVRVTEAETKANGDEQAPPKPRRRAFACRTRHSFGTSRAHRRVGSGPGRAADLPEVRHRDDHPGLHACEIFDMIPAKVVVRVRFDETVACPHDDSIASTPVPRAIVDRGKLADTLIVEAVADKCIEHQPVERQCARNNSRTRDLCAIEHAAVRPAD